MVNKPTLAILGYEKEVLIQSHFSKIMQNGKRENIQNVIKLVEGTRRDVISRILMLTNKQGEVIPTFANMSAVLGYRKQLHGVILICRDVREILETRKVMQEQEEKLEPFCTTCKGQ